MPVIKNVLEEEYNRLLRMEKAYRNKIADLPKGTIVVKMISGRKYNYLAFRRDGKVVTEYIKTNPEEVQKLKKKILFRQKHEKALRSILEDLKFVKVALKKK
jgi:hypothetical protein